MLEFGSRGMYTIVLNTQNASTVDNGHVSV